MFGLERAKRIALAGLAVLMIAGVGLGVAPSESGAAPPPACPQDFELSDDSKFCVRPAEFEPLDGHSCSIGTLIPVDVCAIHRIDSTSPPACPSGFVVDEVLCAVERIDIGEAARAVAVPPTGFTG